ncbi:MAG: hypothetical protein ACI4S2_17930 [Lachnospiraceae bacterium]
MNKQVIDSLLPEAYKTLEKNISTIEDGKKTIKKAYRGQISTFGAAIISGSLLSAIAFFSDKGDADVNREKLMVCIQELIPDAKMCDSLFDYVSQGTEDINVYKEKILNAAIALKLAMNLFVLVK